MRFSFSSLLRFVLFTVLVAAGLVGFAPGCGRSSLESDILDSGTDGGGVCSPQTCPTGCCDRTGQCRTGTDLRFCGQLGNTCSDCAATGFDTCGDKKTCSRSGCTDCKGCCDRSSGTDRCVSGIDANACGTSGATCTDCTQQGRTCDPTSGACSTTKCDATNCSGCCVGDKCLPGTDPLSCGQNGQQCISCATQGQTCQAQKPGGRCVGTPTCGPENCGGCCDGTTCVTGVDATACGAKGAACANCAAAGQVCNTTTRQCETHVTCGPANCPGCCAGNECVVAETPAACGKAGQACFACAPNETCDAGVCKPAATCDPATCPGCCIGDICAAGNQNTACGLGGQTCQNCAGMVPQQVCQGGVCQAQVCGPANCAGCCQGNTCTLGVGNNACGAAGAACTDCTQVAPAGTKICDAASHQCVQGCGPGNCGGCCTNATRCVLGFANNACGSGGGACRNCSAAGSTCDALVDPRVCTNQQNTCPAPYNQCPVGVTTPVTPTLQNLCSDLDLDALQSACAGGPDSAPCVAAMQVLAATSPTCAACVRPFDVPYQQLSGIYRCVAPQVSNTCNRATGCAVDCTTSSCQQCSPANQQDCQNEVDRNGGQCFPYVGQTNCVVPFLGPGQICSPTPNFGVWFRRVADHFCGNGP